MKLANPTFGALCLLTGTWLATAPVASASSVLATIKDLEPGDLEVRGFALSRDQEVRVEALGLDDRRRGHKSFQIATAWILDADSREVVWALKDANSGRRQREVREYESTLRLDAGTYEAYYATFPTPRYEEGEGWWQSAARSVARVFGWSSDEDYEDAIGDLRLEVHGDGKAVSTRALQKLRHELRDGAALAMMADGDDFSATHGFVLNEPTDFLVYALGELTSDGDGFDYGWIVDTTTREKVWSFGYEQSKRAGGAGKNRAIYDTLRLPAGKYAAYYVTDGSHSPEHWNALPPHDPSFWGLTLWLKDPQQASQVEFYDYQHLPDDDLAIVELTRMRDDDHRSYGFTLSRAVDLRVYAVGEGRGPGMDDYGWIVDARTRNKVWSMDYERTEHAGGSKKNRVADEFIRLEPGSYIASFVTDGSHAYRDWNADPPAEPERWGLSLYAEEGFDRSVIAEYREEEDPNVLARIARVKSHSHRRHQFTLSRQTDVSVYALGEGTHGEMYDYAWLEDASGKVIWEMTYPMTDSAGGAPKNRLYQGMLKLGAGSYTLHYRTDDSHAFRDWNASPPSDPDAWGVQIALVE